eukprot:3211656-Heterocapsa_arctica.AAC.1
MQIEGLFRLLSVAPPVLASPLLKFDLSACLVTGEEKSPLHLLHLLCDCASLSWPLVFIVNE